MVSLKSAGELNFLADSEESFLSNFYPTRMMYCDHIYKTAEQLYQSAKCVKFKDRQKIRDAETAKKAKILGNFVTPRDRWEQIKVYTMENILDSKFSLNPELRDMLCNTNGLKLISLNYWHDTFWGCCVCSKHKRKGQNKFGLLLMKIRCKLIKQEDDSNMNFGYIY